MTDNIIKTKAKAFALRVIKLYQVCTKERNEFVLSKQLLRSGTSIGANINEALCAISKKDFLAKMYIAYKESAESLYWIELMNESGYIYDNESDSLKADCEELKIILSSITKTTREKVRKDKE